MKRQEIRERIMEAIDELRSVKHSDEIEDDIDGVIDDLSMICYEINKPKMDALRKKRHHDEQNGVCCVCGKQAEWMDLTGSGSEMWCDEHKPDNGCPEEFGHIHRG